MAPTQRTRPALLILAATIVGLYLFHILFRPFAGLDFSIYRMGAMTIFDNEGFTKELYDRSMVTIGELQLPFTYPPFAAMVFVPFAFLPFELGYAIMLSITCAAAWWVSALIYDHVQKRGYRIYKQDVYGRTGTIALLTALVLLSGPWLRTFDLGQINPIILLLVLADFMRPATRVPRGVLIGIAGGLKLTPLAFGLVLLMRRDFKGVMTLGLSFGATVALGFALMPAEAHTFWFSAVSDPARVGDINFVDNISIQGWLAHFGMTGSLLKYSYYALAALSIVLAALALYQLNRRKLVLAEISVAGMLMVSLSPISWSHHNVWLPIIIAVLAVDAFPLFFKVFPAWLQKLARVLFWVGAVGLFISPRAVGGATWGSMDNLEHLWAPGVLIGGLPIFALWCVVIVLWGASSCTRQIRSESVQTL
ncbi:MAG: glycosyltransferase 87 family protein [Rothia sp. (in: high G+C Gram-positive bacteria)]|uniref:glycosyltransferase 87 family protein n=1 Tax=Rothia sp. (in: high G+C Gram-positive bacteria) TaxID=1885016 RepID=UPI0026DEFC63|nr:glycosyltransferase 87 family protein [Rothia sp. (in: high G+C Gram-positive bacteria)]MDO5750465.1 glycosyltransferase 87 family protein [Rothia sp. (in: high G+C Gram-positive bacteria)]